MIMNKLVLINYKRLMLSNIRHFEWTVGSSVTLLLGSNGSGKSSVIEEATPCPAHHEQFEAGGRKEYHCTHDNNTYALISEYSGRGTGKHSFKRGGVEELNPGGTFAVQKELVWKTFNVDRAIHEILIGLTPFTGMTPAKRREWLTKMSPSDLGFIFEKYNLSRSLMSDARGVVNHKAKRMANENIDLPSDAEMDDYREEIVRLTNQLQQLYRTRGNEPSRGRSMQPLRGRYDELRRRAKLHLESTPDISALREIHSREDVVARIQVALHAAQSCKKTVEELALELDDLERQKVPEADIGTPEQIEELQAELTRLKDQVMHQGAVTVAYRGEWPLVKHDVFPHSKALLLEMSDTWNTLIQEFPNNPDEYFSHQRGSDARLRFTENKTRLQSLGERHSTATRRLAQLRGCATVVCPDCTHTFVPGQSPDDVTAAEQQAHMLAGNIEAIEKEQAELGPYIDSYDEYLTYIARFRQLVRQYELYKPIWEYAVQQRIMFVEPRRHLSAIIAWQEAQRSYIELTEAEQRIHTVADTLRRFSTSDNGQGEFIRRRQEVIDQKITHASDQQSLHMQEAVHLRDAVKEVDNYQQRTEQLIADLRAYIQEVNEQVVDLVKQGFDEEIKVTSVKLSDIQATLHRFELRENTLKDIEREHNEAKLWHTDLQLLAKAMSPTDGLIGRYLMGFMQKIVRLLNTIIDDLWTYPLEVLPSKVDKDELDYNFPLNVRNGAVMAPDIARGSSSQRDVVNFAFKLIFMKFMGLEHFPLYLDEFGNTFDEQHRQNLIPFLNKLLELGEVQQILYISHFSATHGAFNHADVVVLDPTNITLPPVYNRYVTLA